VAAKKAKAAGTKLELEKKDLLEQLASLTRDKSRLRTEVEALRVAAGATAVVDVGVRNAKERELLRNWKRDWKITLLNRVGSDAFVNLGHRHKVTPQLTFSVHGTAPDGTLLPVAKAFAEVVEVVGAELSRVRLRYPPEDERDRDGLKARAKNPVLEGDRLFTASWDPDRPRRVVIAGVIDLAGDRRDASKALKRMLERQGTVVDGILDLEADEPALKGSLTPRTDFLIEGDLPDPAVDPRARNKDFLERVRRELQALRRQAGENGTGGRELAASLNGFRQQG